MPVQAALSLFTISVLSLCVVTARSDELATQLAFWEAQAFYCTEHGLRFPSKESKSGPPCDDGDMTLFNGLLCASGDIRGCEGVRQAQGPDGRWWRSPDRIGKESGDGYDVSFSPDQAMGVMLYATVKKDRTAFERWISWIDQKRPCVIKIGNNCLLGGWPRYCTDDPDKRCTLRPADCGGLETIGANLGASIGGICKKVLSQFQIDVGDFLIPVDHLAAGSALLNDPGYPMHLAGVRILLLELNGLASHSTRFGALTLALREPKNPFFLFLSEGKTQRVRKLLLDLCPSATKPSLGRTQWAWERQASEEAWKESMYWDCIFMANLLK